MGFIKLWGIRFGTLVFGGFCVVRGAFGLYVAATNLVAARMGCAEFLAKKPMNRWVQVDDCWADYAHGVNVRYSPEGRSGRSSRLVGYAALYESAVAQGPIRAYLRVDDPQKGVDGGYKNGTKPFWGLAEGSFLADDHGFLTKNKELEVDPGFVVVDPDEKPHPIASLLTLAFGGCLWLLFYATFRHVGDFKKTLA